MLLALILVASLTSTFAAGADAYLDYERSIIGLFRRVAPSVVHVAVEKASSTSNDQSKKEDEYGTGFIWGNGYVVTNAHVVSHAVGIAVVLPSGAMAPAKIIGLAPYYDLAVLSVQADNLPNGLVLADSSMLQVGQSAYAIGNPFGLDRTLTSGIVSALRRRTVVEGKHEIPDAIQTDAAINPGNSGGPLLDSAGKVIGITTSIMSSSGNSSGVGFAVPVNTVKRAVPELIKTGHATFPGIGAVIAPQSVAVSKHTQGLVVQRVLPNSPAARAGLKGMAAGSAADAIISAQGAKLTSLADLSDQVVKVGIGNTIELKVTRDGKEQDVRLEVIDEAADQ